MDIEELVVQNKIIVLNDLLKNENRKTILNNTTAINIWTPSEYTNLINSAEGTFKAFCTGVCKFIFTNEQGYVYNSNVCIKFTIEDDVKIECDDENITLDDENIAKNINNTVFYTEIKKNTVLNWKIEVLNEKKVYLQVKFIPDYVNILQNSIITRNRLEDEVREANRDIYTFVIESSREKEDHKESLNLARNKIDDLQNIISRLKSEKLSIPLQFINFKK